MDQGRFLWAMAIDSSFDNADKGRRPPLGPAGFRELLKTKKFTNNADTGTVADLFEKTAMSVLSSTDKLELDYVPVQQGDGKRLCEVLSLCPAIEELAWCVRSRLAAS